MTHDSLPSCTSGAKCLFYSHRLPSIKLTCTNKTFTISSKAALKDRNHKLIPEAEHSRQKKCSSEYERQKKAGVLVLFCVCGVCDVCLLVSNVSRTGVKPIGMASRRSMNFMSTTTLSCFAPREKKRERYH